MDDYLSDKEQVERLRQWWRENGWFLIGGVALGLLAFYGYNQYFAYQARRSEAASTMYAAVKEATDDSDTAAAEAAFEQMRSEYPDHAYTFQAAMLVAGTTIVTAPDGAAQKLRYAMEESDDPELAMIARLRLARVLAYREQYPEALALLNVPEPGAFAGRIAEIRGDIHAALGETDAARTAYLEALVTPGAELLDRNFLQMKLTDLSSPPSAAVPASSNESTETQGEPAQESAPQAGASSGASPAGAAQAGEGA